MSESTIAPPQTSTFAARKDWRVADLSMAPFGRKEMLLAEHEMPGPHGAAQGVRRLEAARRRRISGSLHMTIQTAVLIETLTTLGAEVRWASCNIFSTQDHAAAAVVVGPTRHRRRPARRPGVRLEGRDARGVLVVHRADDDVARRARRPSYDGPNMILDDGGDATMLLHKGVEFEKAGEVPDPTEASNAEFAIVLGLLQRSLKTDPGKWTRMAATSRASPRRRRRVSTASTR